MFLRRARLLGERISLLQGFLISKCVNVYLYIYIFLTVALAGGQRLSRYGCIVSNCTYPKTCASVKACFRNRFKYIFVTSYSMSIFLRCVVTTRLWRAYNSSICIYIYIYILHFSEIYICIYLFIYIYII